MTFSVVDFEVASTQRSIDTPPKETGQHLIVVEVWVIHELKCYVKVDHYCLRRPCDEWCQWIEYNWVFHVEPIGAKNYVLIVENLSRIKISFLESYGQWRIHDILPLPYITWTWQCQCHL